MKHININLLEDIGKFQLVCLPISVYQKKDGTVPVQKDSLLGKIVEKFPDLPTELGNGVERFGNCPAILSSVPNTPYPTKFITFPTSPSNLRAENPDNYVFKRLQGKFKKHALLPGWSIVPRSDMVEFSSIKLNEIIKFYKLTEVVIPFELFTFDRDDKSDYERVLSIIGKHIKSNIYISHETNQPSTGTEKVNVSSEVSMDDEE